MDKILDIIFSERAFDKLRFKQKLYKFILFIVTGK